MHLTTSNLVLATTAAFVIGVSTPVFAQEASTPDVSAPTAHTASAPLTKEHRAEKRKEERAQRKAARKAARAKNSAELKKLEDSGYKPGYGDPNYPQNLQNAQKKAAGAEGASQ
jgi:hypothetical protein